MHVKKNKKGAGGKRVSKSMYLNYLCFTYLLGKVVTNPVNDPTTVASLAPANDVLINVDSQIANDASLTNEGPADPPNNNVVLRRSKRLLEKQNGSNNNASTIVVSQIANDAQENIAGPSNANPQKNKDSHRRSKRKRPSLPWEAG